MTSFHKLCNTFDLIERQIFEIRREIKTIDNPDLLGSFGTEITVRLNYLEKKLKNLDIKIKNHPDFVF